MSKQVRNRSLTWRIAVIVVLWVLSGCGGGSSYRGEEVYQRLLNGEFVDFNALNCAQLDFLQGKYESIRDDSADAGASGSSPAAEASMHTAMQVSNRLAQVYSAKANNFCS